MYFFSADDEGRTELPTDQKKQKAREEGRVLKSTEINTAISLLLLFALFFFMLSYFALDLAAVFKEQASKLPEVMKMSVYAMGFAYIRSIMGYVRFIFFASLAVNFLLILFKWAFYYF